MKEPGSQEPQFCDDCPMRGDIDAPLEKIYATDVEGTVTRLFAKPYPVELGTYGVFTDFERNTSEPIRLPNLLDKKNPKRALSKALEHIKEDIALCNGPDTEPGIIRKKRLYIVGCHALRGLSLQESITDDINLESIANELKTTAKLATYTSGKPDLDGELRDIIEE